MQLDIFSKPDDCQSDHVMDAVNERFGAYTMVSASLLERTRMNDVIAPAWRPLGVRRSV